MVKGREPALPKDRRDDVSVGEVSMVNYNYDIANRLTRAYQRMRSVKFSRTIADLVGSEEIQSVHLGEALQYHPKIILG